MTKEETIKLIAGRINDEYRKHSAHIEEWPTIAAAKIYNQWLSFYSQENPELEAEVKRLREENQKLKDDNFNLKHPF